MGKKKTSSSEAWQVFDQNKKNETQDLFLSFVVLPEFKRREKKESDMYFLLKSKGEIERLNKSEGSADKKKERKRKKRAGAEDKSDGAACLKQRNGWKKQ